MKRITLRSVCSTTSSLLSRTGHKMALLALGALMLGTTTESRATLHTLEYTLSSNAKVSYTFDPTLIGSLSPFYGYPSTLPTAEYVGYALPVELSFTNQAGMTVSEKTSVAVGVYRNLYATYMSGVSGVTLDPLSLNLSFPSLNFSYLNYADFPASGEPLTSVGLSEVYRTLKPENFITQAWGAGVSGDTVVSASLTVKKVSVPDSLSSIFAFSALLSAIAFARCLRQPRLSVA